MITLTEAKYIDGYRIWIKFTDGLSGIVDFTDIIHNYPAAQPLTDQNEFQRFYLDDWPTLAWPCGFDFSPESLYERATGQSVPWLHNNRAEELTNA
jgi:hypothetical protein